MKSYVVTGANKGIGLALVKRILQEIEDSFVFLCSRNLERGNTALNSLVQENASFASRVSVVELDVSSADSRVKAAKTVEQFLNDNQDKAPLEGLVNNAGIMGTEYSLRETLDVNFLAAKAFTELMLPQINKTGRIVHMSSAAGPNFVKKCNEAGMKFFKNPNITWEEMEQIMANFSKDLTDGTDTHLKEFGITGEDFYSYGFSKALMNCLTMLQAKEHPTMKINACTPGFIMTDLTANYVKGDIEKAKAMGAKTPEEGASSALHLLKSDDLGGNGWFYGSDCLRSPLHKYRAPGSPAYDGSED